MSFTKLSQTTFPRRLWSLVGHPGVGKSTFAAQMDGPILVVDADHRFSEVASLVDSEVYEVSDNPADHVDAKCIASSLKASMQGSGVRTIVVDSLTAIITPLVIAAVLENDAGMNTNRVAAYKPKSLAMRILQDSITCWGADTLWIYHLRRGLDAKARATDSTSISAVELARLRRSLNMELRIVKEDAKRAVIVDWARRGRYSLTLWDETGSWIGMPERIEEAVYGGLNESDMASMEKAVPSAFSSPAQAIAWGMEQGCFRDAVHAQNAYEQLKREQAPSSAAVMKALWIEDVQARVAGRSTLSDEEYDHYQEALAAPVKR